MKDFLSVKTKELKNFFSEYGKIFTCTVLAVFGLIISLELAQDLSVKKLEVSFLDVGQGDAIFIKTPSGQSVIIDGGPGEKVLQKLGERLPYFTKDLDVMVSTHPDADHITGLIPILEKFNVKHIVTSPLAGHTEVSKIFQKKVSEESAVLHIGEKGDQIIFDDGVLLTILHPKKLFIVDEDNTNDVSISVIVTYGDRSVLLTGDLPSIYEGALIGYSLPKNVTIYKAGHHGSKYSSGQQLLSYIKPEYAVISAGKNNKYGHPNDETLVRLKKYAKEILSTEDAGTISFTTDGELVEVKIEK